MFVRFYQKCFLKTMRFQSRAFSSNVAAFDTTLNPNHWPFPLREYSCNELSSEQVDKDVTISGWVDSIRIMKDSVFIVIRDGYGKVQTLFQCDKEGSLSYGYLI